MAADAMTYAWDQQSIWSQAANRMKRTIGIRRTAVLALTLVGALLSAAAATVGLGTAPGKAAAFVSAVVIGGAGLARALLSQDYVRDWTRARSVSEALKSEVWLHRAGLGDDDLDATIARLDAVSGDLRQYTAGITPRVRDLPPVSDLDTYLTERVGKQSRDYYHRNADDLRSKLRAARIVECVLAGIGVVLAAAAGTWEWDRVAVWVPVVTTVGAAIATHAAAQRWSYSLVEYERTASELDALLARRGTTATMSGAQLARRAEEIISIQNEAWMAKLAEAPEA